MDTIAESPAGKSYRKLFGYFGVEFRTESGEQLTARECPFCGGDKLGVNDRTGQYQCLSLNSCGEKGNALTFVRWQHARLQEATTDAHLRPLCRARGWSLQTAKRHGFVYDPAGGRFYLPYRNPDGEVVNLQEFRIGWKDKRVLPCLPLALYGLDQQTPAEKRGDKTALVCEGATDLITVDQHLRQKKTRDRYDLIAAPSAGVYRPKWLPHLEGYAAVRLCFDNDKAGRDGMERVVKLAREAKFNGKLSVLIWPPGTREKYDLGDAERDGVSIPEFTKEHCRPAAVRERVMVFTKGSEVQKEAAGWLVPLLLPSGTFVSLAGQAGKGKSLIAKDLTARTTAGLSFPGCDAGLPATDVIYLTSEDTEWNVADLVDLHGGDLNRLHVFDLSKTSGDLDLLRHLPDLEEQVRATDARLIVIDALNSFVGGDISTDARGRRSLSGPLHYFARRTNTTVLGIRNVDGDGRAMGAQSLSDVARCVLKVGPYAPPAAGGGEPKPVDDTFVLSWEKMNVARKPSPLLYTMKDQSTGPADAHRRKLVWLRECGKELMTSLRAKAGRKGGDE